MSDDDADTMLGWMIVGSINDHYPYPDDDIPFDPDTLEGNGGCIVNCGPCKALHWFSRNNRQGIEDCVRKVGYDKGGWVFWDRAQGTLRWDWFEQYWASHRGCWFTNGVSQGCTFEGDDDDDLG